MKLERCSGCGRGRKEVNIQHPDEIENENPLQREERSPSGFGSEEACPGDEDGGEVKDKLGDGGDRGRVAEDPDQERNEKDHLFIRDAARMDEIG